MIKLKIFSVAILLSQILFGQNTFQIEYGGAGEEKLRFTFENSTGSFISMGSKQENHGSFPTSPVILEINNSGEIINELIYTKPDTSFYLQYGYEKANGNYFVIGTMSDSLPSLYLNKNYITYVCEITPEFNILWEKYYAIPAPYRCHRLANFILDADSNLYVHGNADSSLSSLDHVLLTMKFDKYCNQLVEPIWGMGQRQRLQ